MPYANLSDVNLQYLMDGPPDAPVLVLSNSLGTTTDLWAPQLPSLTKRFRVLRYDTRGHGNSSIPDGEYSFTQLAADVVNLLDYLRIDRVHFCGISMGGLVGLQLALDWPDRLDKLVLCSTASRVGSADGWASRIFAVAESGLENLAPGLVDRWLTPAFRDREPVHTRLLIDMLRRTSDHGYISNCAALRDADLTSRVNGISAPTLVISGTHDPAATPQQGQDLAAAIHGARYVELDASHISNWEQPERFTRALVDFLS